MPKLIEKRPDPPPGQEDNPLRRAGRFLRRYEMKLITLKGIKDSHVEQFGEQSYKEKDDQDLSKEFLEAGVLILELVQYLATIQTERLSDLVELMENPETAIEALIKSRGENPDES